MFVVLLAWAVAGNLHAGRGKRQLLSGAPSPAW